MAKYHHALTPDQRTEQLLVLNDVSVRYPGQQRRAVDRVSLAVATGEVLALLGPSGCGKSSLLRAIAGLEALDGGRIMVAGNDIAAVPIHRRGIGLMFQDGVLFNHRTVAGNIGYGLSQMKMSTSERARRIAYLLDLVGLPGWESRSVTSLSGGQAQRVALARALAPQPRLLLLDEPLAALDRALREKLLEDLRRILTTTGTTAVFVTHDQAEAFVIADMLAVMQSGKIRQIGSPATVFADPSDTDVAAFVGYRHLLDTECARLLLPGHRTGHLALRPSALVADPDGRFRGTVRAVQPTPDATRLEITLDVLGDIPLAAVAASLPAIGQRMCFRLEKSGVCVVE